MADAWVESHYEVDKLSFLLGRGLGTAAYCRGPRPVSRAGCIVIVAVFEAGVVVIMVAVG